MAVVAIDRRDCIPTLTVTGGHNTRVSLPPLIAVRPGYAAWLIYRARCRQYL